MSAVDSVMSQILEDYGVPSLRMFAKRQIFRRLDDVLPSWTTRIYIENLTLQDKLRCTNSRLDKLVSRVRRRANRVREAIHEMEYIASKLEEIEISIRDGRTVYAAGELRCLRNLNSGLRELQYWRNLISVSESLILRNRIEAQEYFTIECEIFGIRFLFLDLNLSSYKLIHLFMFSWSD